MIYPPLAANQFEFAVVAALRAKQLMAGCTPRVTPAGKRTSTAALEVLAGKVARCSPDAGMVPGPIVTAPVGAQ